MTRVITNRSAEVLWLKTDNPVSVGHVGTKYLIPQLIDSATINKVSITEEHCRKLIKPVYSWSYDCRKSAIEAEV